MSNQAYLNFLELWDRIMVIGCIALVAAAVLVYLYHRVRQSSIKDLKEKHDYLAEKDIRMQMISIWLIAIGIWFVLNTTAKDTMKIHYVWFIVRMFITFCIATLIVYISYLLYKYSYPATLDKKLKLLRYKPRISSTGAQMRLLSEEEEDVHLDEGMQAEESVFSVDYDVWVDEKSGEVKIEKYAGRLAANKCNTCGFYTMKLINEEVVEPATHETEGELAQYYICSYCGAKRTKTKKIARLAAGQEMKLPEKMKFKGGKKVETIKLEIFMTDGSAKDYEFQNVEQASKFLSQFDKELKQENALFEG
jgi:hypothetical protein